MSFAPKELLAPPVVAEPRDAAAVILVRGDGPERELFWVRRGESLRFSGGFYAFPGGKVDRADRELQVEGATGREAATIAAAVRELWEETGVLIARGAERLSEAEREEGRAALLGGGSFAALLARHGLTLHAAPFLPAGRWVTPPISPIRFDARFFLARLPEGQRAHVIPGELTDGAFVRPTDALARWSRGEVLLHPPNHHAIATLAGFDLEDAVSRLRAPPFVDDARVVHRIEFRRGVHLCALRTPTLPPATHTNCWVLGTGELAVIDPGAHEAEDHAPLVALLDALLDEGRSLQAIWLTHAHEDHVGAAVAIARRYGVPIRAHARAAAKLPFATTPIEDGERLTLGGPAPMALTALLTEGHADGHLVFHEPATGALFCGDLVSSISTIVLDPPEGRLGAYLASLRRAIALGPGAIFPAHGYPIADGPAKLHAYVAHREARLAELHAALVEGVRGLQPLVERVYAETPAILHPIAQRSALASLHELVARGLARVDGEHFLPA